MDNPVDSTIEMSMHDLTGFQRDLLFVVAMLDKPHGLEIKDELQKHYDQHIRHGRLYPNLDTLVEAGLIEKGKQDQRSNEYRLQEHGVRELQARLEWEIDCLPAEILDGIEGIAIEREAEEAR